MADKKTKIENSNDTANKTKSMILTFVPVLLSYVFQGVAVFATLAIIMIKEFLSIEGTPFDASDATNSASTIAESASNGNALSGLFGDASSSGIFMFIKFFLFVVIFGIWYYRSFVNKDYLDKDDEDYVPFKEMPVVKFITPINVVLLVVLGVLIQLFVDGILNILYNTFPHSFSSYMATINSMNGNGVSILMILAACILGPIGEELLFRGLTQGYAKNYLPAWGAIVLSSVCFGLYHGNVVQGIYAGAIGLLLGFICIKTESILPGIILHIAINSSSYFVPVTLFSKNIMAATIVVIAAALIVVIFCYFKRMYKKMMSSK